MVVDISRISKSNGASMDIDYVEEIRDLEVNGHKVDFAGPVKVEGKMTNLGEVYIFDGIIKGEIIAACDRCLTDLNHRFENDINEKFSNEADNSGETNLFQGHLIDFRDAVRHNILLNLPLQFLCSDECKGLCPKCGANRNVDECSCSDEHIDPRFEKLKNLLK